jgi:glycosyltransferase involved in cell wall biosynthesis
MNAADCLLLTSDAEGSPTVVQEALATNLPVVSVDVGDVRERVRGIRHCLVTDRTPEALAAALTQVLTAGERSNGSTRSDEICSRRIADELTQVYRDLTARALSRRKLSWNTTLSSQR